jgi:hypothetical protein
MAKKQGKDANEPTGVESPNDIPENVESESPEVPITDSPRPFESPEQRSKMQKLKHWCKTHKKTSIVAAILLVLAILGAVPLTRYAIAGLVIKQDVVIEAVDSQTHQPVSNAAITLGSKTAQTDGRGRVTIRSALGNKTVSLSKKYYELVNKKVLVGLRKPPVTQIQVKATGRQVPITVMNKVSGKPIENATVKALDTDAKTDKNGHATLTLPADKTTLPATVSGAGFKSTSVTVQVTATQVAANSFTLAPSGSLFFLSNLSGKIDVVKTDLDGANRQTVLSGTGKEDATNTVLLASRDWKYLALLSKRDGAEKLFLIDTSNNALTTMDEGNNVTFALSGWDNDTFVYVVYRNSLQAWEPGQQVLKGFSAPNKKLTQLDQTTATGTNASDYLKEQFGSVYLLSNEIVYPKSVSSAFYRPGGVGGQQTSLFSIHSDGSAKKTIKAFPTSSSNTSTAFISLRPYGPNDLYVQDSSAAEAAYYEYEDGQFKPTTDVNNQNFFNAYPTYLLSPSGKQTFWTESRDGKNALFTGNEVGEEEKQIASLSEYNPYGWYSDDYLLVSKNGSELYIMSASGSGQPVKISDYYKPNASFKGYGGGYGGL